MKNKPTILVTGANGQLGSELKSISNDFADYNFTFVSKEDLPIDDYIAVENFFQNNTIDICINCAAYTAVDKAETEVDKSFAVNATGASNLATQCAFYKAQFIHISTDYVFDGTATTPIKEDATTNPLGVYGASKLKGEQLVLQINPSAIIIRTSWVYSVYGNNFVKTMLRLMKERESINVVNDQIGIPTNAKDLANAIMQIIEKSKAKSQNQKIYHFSNLGNAISWYNFAEAIKEISNSACVVNPIPTSQYPTPAKRPAYSVLDTSLITQTFGITIPNWKKSLQECLKILI